MQTNDDRNRQTNPSADVAETSGQSAEGVPQSLYGGSYDDEDHVVDLDDPEAMEC
jgi:hypothetical protein